MYETHAKKIVSCDDFPIGLVQYILSTATRRATPSSGISGLKNDSGIIAHLANLQIK